MKYEMTALIRKHLEASAAAIDALESAHETKFFEENEEKINEMLKDSPGLLDKFRSVVAGDYESMKKAGPQPKTISVLINHTGKRMQVILPAGRNTSGDVALRSYLSSYGFPRPAANGPYRAYETYKPRTDTAELEFEEGLKSALSSVYPNADIIVAHSYKVDLGEAAVASEAPAKRKRGRPPGSRNRKPAGAKPPAAPGGKRPNRYTDVGDDYFEVELTEKEIGWGILRFPRAARHLLPGYKEDFKLSNGESSYEVWVSAGKANTPEGDPKAGDYISRMTQFYRDNPTAPGTKARVQKTDEKAYRISLRASE